MTTQDAVGAERRAKKHQGVWVGPLTGAGGLIQSNPCIEIWMPAENNPAI